MQRYSAWTTRPHDREIIVTVNLPRQGLDGGEKAFGRGARRETPRADFSANPSAPQLWTIHGAAWC